MAQDTRLRDIRHWMAGSGMNLDDDARTLKPNEHREVLNSIIAVSESNHASCLENIKGTVNVFDLPVNANLDVPSGLRAIGSCEDVKDNAVIFHLRDTVGSNHAILRYHNSDSRCEWILKNEPLLNYKDGYPVFSNRIGDLLYWTDGYFGSFLNNDFNPPRKLNIVRAMGYTNPFSMVGSYVTGEYVGYEGKVYQCLQNATGVFITDTDYWGLADNVCYSEVTSQLLEVIRYRPEEQPYYVYETDSTRSSNFIRCKQFQFAYSYIFLDNEKSVLSPFTTIVNPSTLENFDGSYNVGEVADNYINVTVNSGVEDVKRILIYVREGNTGVWKLFKSVNKYDESGTQLIVNDIEITYSFYNSEVLLPADQDDLSRIFDHVPHTVSHKDIIERNRLVFASFREGYDNIDIDVALSVSTEEAGNIGTIVTDTLTENSVVFGVCKSIPTGQSYYQYFYRGKIDFASFWQPGFNYNITIQCYPYKYIPRWPQPYFAQCYGDAYYDRNINNTISIFSPLGSTIEQFLNIVVESLRSENFNSVVIAMNNYDYKDMDGYGVVINPNGGNLCSSTELAFIFEDTLPIIGGYEPPAYQDSVVVKIEKYQGRNIVPTFKSGEYKLFGLSYYDIAGRCGAVNVSETSKAYVPSQIEYGTQHTIYRNNISWTINHTPPVWAKYYRWMFAKNSSYYLYAEISEMHIVSGSTNISICVNYSIVSQGKSAKKFNVSAYKWEKGDRIRFIFNKNDNNEFYTIPAMLDMEIIGELLPGEDTGVLHFETDGISTTSYKYDANGNKIPDISYSGVIVSNFNYQLYGIEAHKTIVEIYRPVKQSTDSLYYEYGEVYPILYPFTDNRVHAQTTGTFEYGDAYITNRNTLNVFPVERSSYSDFYDSDALSIGQPNAVNPNMRNQWYISNLRYGGLYIENTQVNELSKFLASDTITLPEKFGAINFIKEIGFTLKVIQKYKPSSIYIGRQGLTQADVSRGEVLYASNNTLGTVTINPNSNYGTQHPLSCFLHEGNLYGYCINSGVVWRDSGNGIRSISQPEEGDTDQSMYKVKILTQTKSRIFASHDVQVFTAYDGRYDIVYFCFVDDTDTAESYTIGFHEPSNCWVSFYSFIPEFITAMKMTTLSWKSSGLWLHNEGTRMNFYGVQYAQYVKTVSNIHPLLKKRFLALTENASGVWHLGTQGDVYIPPDETYKRGQTSLIKAGAFRDIEGTIYAPFGKNMTTHQLLPTNDDYLNGDDIRGNFIELTLRNSDTDETNLFSIEVDSVVSNP